MDETEERINALLQEAAPLRLLDEDDPAKHRLTKLVDQINALRRVQENESRALFDRMLAVQGTQAAIDAERQRMDAEANARVQVEDEDLPSRAEMEAAASRLGVQYRANLGDQKLFERLSEAGWNPEEES